MPNRLMTSLAMAFATQNTAQTLSLAYNIGVLFHIGCQIQRTAIGPLQMFKVLGRLVQDLQLRDAVQTVVGNVVVLVIVAYQVIFSFFGRHLIGGDDVHPLCSVGAGFNVMALVRAVFQILEADLSASADGLAQQLDGQKQLLVVGFVLRQASDVLHPPAEIHIR